MARLSDYDRGYRDAYNAVRKHMMQAMKEMQDLKLPSNAQNTAKSAATRSQPRSKRGNGQGARRRSAPPPIA